MILGGYLKVRPVVEMENVMVGLKKTLPDVRGRCFPPTRRRSATAARSSVRYADGSGFRWVPEEKSGRPEGRRFFLFGREGTTRFSASVPSVRLVVFPLFVF